MQTGVTIRDNIRSTPEWAADELGGENILPVPARLNVSAMKDALGVLVKANGGAIVGATSVTVDALLAEIPAGVILHFGGTKFAKLTARAAPGATSIAVEALVTAIADNDEALYSVGNRKYIRGGTYVGRTFAERDASTAFGPADDTDDQRFLIAFDVQSDGELEVDVELVRHGFVVKENFLPEWATISADAPLLAALRADYQCIKGRD